MSTVFNHHEVPNMFIVLDFMVSIIEEEEEHSNLSWNLILKIKNWFNRTNFEKILNVLLFCCLTSTPPT